VFPSPRETNAKTSNWRPLPNVKHKIGFSFCLGSFLQRNSRTWHLKLYLLFFILQYNNKRKSRNVHSFYLSIIKGLQQFINKIWFQKTSNSSEWNIFSFLNISAPTGVWRLSYFDICNFWMNINDDDLNNLFYRGFLLQSSTASSIKRYAQTTLLLSTDYNTFTKSHRWFTDLRCIINLLSKIICQWQGKGFLSSGLKVQKQFPTSLHLIA